MRLYRENMRLSVSRPSWSNDEGMHMGKRVSVDLAANKGNQELIELLLNAIDLLKAEQSIYTNGSSSRGNPCYCFFQVN